MGSAGLINVGNAIAGAEGYGVNSNNNPTRNNNPGDISSNGSVISYPTIEAGQAALNNQINLIASGTSPAYNAYAQSLGLSDSSQLSIQQVGNKWATDSQSWVNNVSTSLGVDPSTKFSDVVNGTTPSSAPGSPNYQTANPPGAVAGIGSGDSGVAPGTSINRQATQAQSVNRDDPTVSYASLFPDVIIQAGLDETPWYADKDLVTGNPKVRGSVEPVVFEVMLKGRDEYILSTSSQKGDTTVPGVPIQVQLNASLKSINTTMKHVFTPKRTRTGWHICMWGMQADLIEGACTTGVFMNQLGLTDFFSTSILSNDLIQAVTSGFKSVSQGTGSFPTVGIPIPQTFTDVYTDPATGRTFTNSTQLYTNYRLGNQQSPSVQSSIVTQQNADEVNRYLSSGGHDPAKAFRIAAQDAFQEFLSLFKNNGIVWFNTASQPIGAKNPDSQVSEQVGVDEWSPQTAMSATSINARNNDVMTRGSIIMKLKGTTYLGYFKSLNWQMSAMKPFSWDFSFVFQVEKTLGYIFTPAFASVSSSV
jgi:hypothetical protein